MSTLMRSSSIDYWLLASGLTYLDCLLFLLGCCVSCSYGDYGRAISWCFCWVLASGTHLYNFILIITIVYNGGGVRQFYIFGNITSTLSKHWISHWAADGNERKYKIKHLKTFCPKTIVASFQNLQLKMPFTLDITIK